MRCLHIAVLLCCCVLRVSSQEQRLDRVRELLKTHVNRDTVRVDLLLQLTEYHATRDFSKNLPIILEADEISNEIGYVYGHGKALNARTKYELQKGNPDKALRFGLMAIKVWDSIKAQHYQVDANNNLARIYSLTNKFDKALEINLTNLALLKDQPPSAQRAGMSFYVGKNYQSLERYKEAEVFFLKALTESKQVGFQTGIAITEGALGTLYKDLGSYGRAIEYLKRTLDFAIKHNQITNQAAAYLSLGHSYRGLKLYKLALEYNSKAIVIYSQTNDLLKLKEAHRLQSYCHKRTGQYKEAMEHLSMYYQYVDSLFAKEKTTIVEELQAKYESEKLQYENENAQRELTLLKMSEAQNTYYWYGLLLFLFLTGIILALLFKRYRNKQELAYMSVKLSENQKRLALEKNIHQSELKTIRAQLNPHFIFNALNSIQEYIVLNKNAMASTYLVKFSRLIRMYLSHSLEDEILLSDEIDALKLYLELEKNRFEDVLDYELMIDKDLPTQKLYVPALLFQPYVENAIKHGLLHKDGFRNLRIDFQWNAEGSILTCVIQDNGVGREASSKINQQKVSNHRSFATSANKKRIELINQTRDHKITTAIIDLYNESGEASGTSVVIKIPFNLNL